MSKTKVEKEALKQINDLFWKESQNGKDSSGKARYWWDLARRFLSTRPVFELIQLTFAEDEDLKALSKQILQEKVNEKKTT
jgi:hypothetical protein